MLNLLSRIQENSNDVCDERESSSDTRMHCQAAGRDWFVLRSMGAAVLFAFVSLKAGSLYDSG